MSREESGDQNGGEEVRFFICAKALPIPEIDPEAIRHLLLHNDAVRMVYVKHVVLRNGHEENITLANRIASEKGCDQIDKVRMLIEIYKYAKDINTRSVIRRMINDLSQ